MSDLCMFEIEDIAWDEFDDCEDHLVPHPDDNLVNEQSCKGDSRKKPRLEGSGVLSNAGHKNASNFSSEKVHRGSLALNYRRKNIFEEDSFSGATNGMFYASCDSDSIKEQGILASDTTRMSGQCLKSSNTDAIEAELCAADSILSEKCPAADTNSYNYPLDEIPQTDREISFFGNDQEGKESNDLLYYGWLDIGNFEDVDRMYREVDDEDELGWFLSSSAFEGSEDALGSDFKFPEPSLSKSESENDDPSEPKNASCSTNYPNMKSPYVSHKVNSWTTERNEPAPLNHSSFSNGFNEISDSKEQSTSKKKTNLNKKQLKDRNQSDGKRKNGSLENAGSFQYVGNSWNNGSKLPSGGMPRQYFAPLGIQKHKNFQHDSFSYSQNDIPYMYQVCGGTPLKQSTIVNNLSGIKSENEGLTSLSPKKSSYALNQMQSMESSRDPSCDSTAITLNEKRENLHQQQRSKPLFPSKTNHKDALVQASICNPIPVQKQVHHSKIELENQSDLKGVNLEIPAELHSSDYQESADMNSGLDKISLEATSFRQLQLVIEKLDLKIKLCIRDSLYRLARSAEQRHSHATISGWRGDDRDTSGALMSEGTNKCTGFMNVETDTNPIDRSIAHLLFHRPSDLSVIPAHDALSHNSHTMIHGSLTGPTVINEKVACQEETIAETERNC